jgi:hypothetical protein
MAISKKIRFEVFKRDGFRCAYCGKTPPSVVLEVDHIEPKSKGGADDINNLITACFDCNRGKKNIPLTKAPAKLSENLEILKEQEAQLREYRKFAKKVEQRLVGDMDKVDEVYQRAFPEWCLSDSFRQEALKTFLQRLPLSDVVDAMNIAVCRMTDEGRAIKYFCGVCWNKIRAQSDPNYETKRELIRFWEGRCGGSGGLIRDHLDIWVLSNTKEQIIRAMEKSDGYYRNLCDILGED